MQLTMDHAKALLEEIVAEKPVGYDYITDPKTIERRNTVTSAQKSSNGCYYAQADGTPGCIIGQLVHKLNPEIELASLETQAVGHVMYRAGIESAEAGIVNYLMDVQSYQDAGQTWRSAVDLANNKWDSK